MTSNLNNRRAFLRAVTAGAGGGLLARTAFAYDRDNSKTPLSSKPSEYLFADGITYLNTGTIGPCRRETIDESLKAWQELESQPVRFYGVSGAEALAEKTRTVAARFLGCDLSEVMITNSTTSGMNAVAQGLRLSAGDRILITDQEHSGGLHCWKYSRNTMVSRSIPSRYRGASSTLRPSLHSIKKAIDKRTKLISVSHVFSSTGLRMPIAEIIERGACEWRLLYRRRHAGRRWIKVDVKALGCHAYATSGHKWLMGPKGTGLLYISKDAQAAIRPMQFDESYNTYNNGNGVVNLPCILGLAKAIEYLESVGIAKVEEHNLSLRNRLHDKLKDVQNLTIVSLRPHRSLHQC